MMLARVGVAACLAGGLTVSAEAANFTRGTATAVKFGVHEISLTGNGGVSNPYDTIATVTFTPPSGSTNAVTVHAFYDGSNNWRARVYVSETGTWNWSSSSSDSGLNAKSGSFSAAASSLRGKLKKHPSDNKAWATDNGQWFLNINDTAYYLFNSASTDWQQFITDNWNLGVTSLRSNVVGALRQYQKQQTSDGWDRIFSDSTRNVPNAGAFQTQDTRMEWMLNNHPDMYLQLIVTPEPNRGWGQDENFWSGLSSTQRTRYLRYITARYAAWPQVFWLVTNDAFHGSSFPNNNAMVSEIGAYLAANDPWKAKNLRSSGRNRDQPFYYTTASWVSYIHLETSNALPANQVSSYTAAPMHVFNGEDWYEGETSIVNDAYFFRRLFWAWTLSGGSADYGGYWNSIVPYGQTNFTGLDDIIHLKTFFTANAIELAGFVPADSRITGPTDAKRVKAMRKSNDSAFVLYHPNAASEGTGAALAGGTASLAVTSLPAGTYALRWMRADDGAVIDAANFTHAGGNRLFTAPWTGKDVVAYLRLATSGPVAPSITSHPQSVSVTAGQTGAFSVTATGSPAPTYQWQKNGTNISGATGANYTTPATSTANNGALYRVVVTNSAGSVTSANATLTVTTGGGGGTVQLAASDVWEQSSFTDGTRWSDGLAPHTGADYVVNGLDLRTPGNSSSHTFGGDSLTLQNGGRLVMRTNGSGVVTIPDLYSNDGDISLALNGTFTLAGSLTLKTGGLDVVSGTSGRTLTITSQISGSGPLVINMANATDHTTLTNSGNTHSGGTVVATGTLRAQTIGALGTGEVVVASTATLHLDYTGADNINALSLDGGVTYVAPGEWGAVGSGAANTSARLTGTGRLQVGGGGQTTYVELTASDTWSQTSFTDGTRWSDGLAPHTGADYVVNGLDLRTPGNTASHTWSGDALLLQDGGRLVMRTTGSGVVTIDDLYSDAGYVTLALNGTFTLAGNLTIQSGGLTVSSGTANRTLTITSQIGGSGALTVSMANATDHTTLANAANAYSGGTTVSVGTLRAQAIGALGSGAVVIGSTATLNLDYTGTATVPALSLNGGTSNVSPGVWGAVGSGAANTSARLTGAGRLQVTGN